MRMVAAALLLCTSLLGLVHSQGVDLTLVAEANGTIVVQACLAKITQANIFPSDNQMLRRIAHVETRDGSDSDTYTPTNSGGIWQLSQAKFTQTKGSSSQLTAPVNGISTNFGITWSTTVWNDLRKPLYSALAARLYMLLISTSIPLANNVNGQASYWVNQYTSSSGTTSEFTTAVNALIAAEQCTVSGLDLYFVLDESGSVGYSNYQLMKTFAYNIANSFTIGPNDVQIGLMSYSSSARFRFYLNTHSTKSAVLSAINNIPYTSGGTNTASALNLLRTSGFTASAGARPSSQGIPRVAIVVTDGYSNSFSQTVSAATALHNAGVIGFAIGISGANTAELNAIASQASYVAFISSFNSNLLANLQQTISNEACTASPEFDVTEMVSSMIGSGETQYVQYNVPSGQSGITIQLNVTNNATAVLYASNVVQTPNEALHDVKLTTSGWQDAFINISDLNPLGSQTQVYVAVGGLSGNVSVQISAEVGDTSTEAVLVSPLPSTISKNFGESLVLPCNVSGKPSPVVSWSKDGSLLTQSSSLQIQTVVVDGNNYTLTSTLTLSSVTDSDEGTYTCTGSNILPNGTVIHSSSFLLDVTGFIPINLVGQVHSSRSISLDWDLPPVPGLSAQVDHYLVNVDELETSRIWTFFAVQSEATILALHPYFSYQCRVAIVTNITHPYSNSITLVTHQEPPTAPPLNPFSDTVTSQSVNMTWFPPPLEHQNGIIQYYLVNVTELATGIVTSYNTTSAWLFLTGLHPFYDYRFVFAAATIGVGPTGSTTTITTLEAAPTAAPVNLAGNVVDSTTIFISWNAPPLSFQNGIIRMYSVRYTAMESGITYTVTTQNRSIDLTGLHPFYNYFISVAAYTVQTGPYSSSIMLKTPTAPPEGSPENFTAMSNSPYEAVLMWEPLPSDQQNGVVTGYVINVTVQETGQTFLLFSNTTTLTVQTRPFRTFICVIAAQTSAGPGPFGPVFILSTPQDAPDAPPSTTTSSSIGSTTFTIHWSPPPPDNQNGVIKYYIVAVTEIETGIVFQYNTTSLSLSLQSLHPAYTYRYRIAAYTIGLGPFSPPISIRTDEEVPSGSPVSFAGISQSPTAITFSWNPPALSDRNGIIISYVLNITLLATGQVFQYTSTSTSITITGLQPFSSYSCLIAAATAVGLGPFTTVLSLMTAEAPPSSAPSITTSFAVDSSTVALQWTPPPVADHNGIIRKYLINATALQTGVSTITETTGTTGIVVSLIPSFTYVFSVSAYTVKAGPYTPLITISLPEDVPSGFPRDLTGSSSTPYSIYLSWNPPPLAEQSGQIVEYIVNVTHAGTLVTVQYTTPLTNINITSLEPYTTYICVVAAGTAVGPGPFSHLFFIRTQEAVPSASPEHASGVSGGPNTIHLAWDPPLLEHQNGEIDGYRINVTEAETGTMFQHLTNQTQITINNLHPFYTYHCYITAVTVGEGPYTDAVTIITDEAAPSAPPQSVSESVQSSSGVFIQWASPPPPNVNGIIRSYTVNLLNTRTGAVLSYSTTQTSINITNLSPYTLYQYNVSATTVVVGPFSTLVSFTTQQAAPSGPPEQFNSTAPSSTTLQLQWGPPSISSVNGIIQHYVLRVYELATDTIVQTTTTTNTQFTVSGLHPYYIYICSVSAVTVGSGPVANVSIQMPEDVPDSAPTSVQSTAVTSTSIDIDWDSLPTEDENGIVRHYIVNVTEVQTGNTFQMMSSDESASLTNLHPAYQYTLTVAAYTIGLGPYSTVLTVTTLEDAPSSAPTSLSSSVQGPTSVLLTWSPPPVADQNGVITLYTVEVINTDTTNVDVYVTGSNSLNLTSLDPHTTYESRIAANTSAGIGPYSTHLAFQTVEDIPTAAPEDVSVEAPSSTTLSIEWMPPPQDDQNGIIRSYVVKVLEVVTSTTLTYNTTEESLTVGFLHPHYQYEVSVAAVTVGQGPFSDSVTIQTPQDAPSGPPIGINISSQSSTDLFISWSPPLPEHTNGIIQHYVVRVTVSESQQVFQQETSSTNLTLSNLHPFYTHTVIVSAVTVAPGPFSNEYVLRLPPDAPSGPPQGITGTVVNSTSLQLSWSPPLSVHQNGLIQSYTIRVFEQQTNSTVVVHQNFQQTTVVIGNLQPNYDYTLSVAAHTVALGPYGSVTFRTSEDAPSGPPQNLSILITSSRSVTLQWLPPRPDQQNGIIQQYNVQLLVLQTSAVLQYTSTLHTLTISNLHPYYTYTCSITAVTVAPGPSVVDTFTLPQDVPTGAPLNVTVLPLNASSLFVSWRAPQDHLQNGVITSYSVLLYEVDTSSTQIVNQVVGTSVSVNGLHPNYMYEVQVAAVTTGLGPYSSKSVVQLPVASPSGSPTGVTGLSTSPYSITISWTAPAPGLLNGAVTGYIINVTHADTLVTVQYNSGSTNVVISNLEPYTTYICVVAAETSAGNGPFSHLILIQTQETAPSGPPEHASGIPVGSTSIHLTWDPPSLQNQNGLIRQYLINISEPISGYWNQTSTDQTQVTITDLLPHRTYTCHVAAVTVAVGPYTQSIMVATEIDVPAGPPLNLSSAISSSTTVTLQWSPPQADLQNGIIQFYNVRVMAAETGSVAEYTAMGLSLTVTGLHPHYSYTCTIAAVTVAPGPVETIMFQMPEDVPAGSPVNVSVSAINSTSLLLVWVAPSMELQNGVIRQYYVNLTSTEFGTYTLISVQNTQQTTLNNLNPYYNYQIRVAAFTIGVGPYSTEVTIQLPEAEPSVSPGNFLAEVSLTPSAFLTWSALQVDQQNGELQGYRLNCFPEDGGPTIAVQVTGTSVTLGVVQDNAHYTCTICAFTSVGCGPLSITYFSTYGDSPVGPPTATVRNVSSTSVLVQWTPPYDPQGLIQRYAITYRLINTSLPIDVPRPPVSTPEISGTSYTLQSLLESSTYSITVYAVTANGTSPGSQEVQVTTTRPDSFTPGNFICQPTSYSMLSCSWDPPDVIGYEVVRYRLSYKLADGFDYYPGYGDVVETTLPSSTQQSYTITSLLPYGGYLMVLEANITAVQDTASSGSGEMTPVDSLPPPVYEIRETSTINTTLADIPTASVRDISVSVASPTSVELSWLPPARDHWKGVIDHYQVTAARQGPVDGRKRRQTSAIVTKNVPPQNNHRDPSLASEPLQMESYVLQGLEEFFEYSISVQPVNAAGSGPTNPPILQNMPEAAPSGPPVDISATATTSSVTVTWSPPSPLEANGIVVGYTLQLTRVRYGGRTETHSLSGTTLDFRKDGLTPYEPIAVTIAAITSEGQGPFSSNNTFYTMEAPPSPPQNIRTSMVDGTSVTVFWSEPRSVNGRLRGYQVIYTLIRNSDQTSDSGSQRQYTVSTAADVYNAILSDLQPGFYEIKVRAQNGAGFGDNSSSAVITIDEPPSTRPTGTTSTSRTDAVGGEDNTLVIVIPVVIIGVLIIVLLGILIVVCIVRWRHHTTKKFDLTRENPESSTLLPTVESNRGAELELKKPTLTFANPLNENAYEIDDHLSTEMTDTNDPESQQLEASSELPTYTEVTVHSEEPVGEETKVREEDQRVDDEAQQAEAAAAIEPAQTAEKEMVEKKDGEEKKTALEESGLFNGEDDEEAKTSFL